MKLVLENVTEEDLKSALKRYGSKLSVNKSYEEIKEEEFTRLREVKPFPSLTNRSKLSEQASYEYTIQSYQYDSDTVLILDEIPKEDLLELLVDLHSEGEEQQEEEFEKEEEEDLEEDDWESNGEEEEEFQSDEDDEDEYVEEDLSEEDEDNFFTDSEDEDEEEYRDDEEYGEDEEDELEQEEDDIFESDDEDDIFESEDEEDYEYEEDDEEQPEIEDEEEGNYDEDSSDDPFMEEDEEDDQEELEEDEDWTFAEEFNEQAEVYEDKTSGFSRISEGEEESSNTEHNVHEQNIEIQTEVINDSFIENVTIENKVKEKGKEKLPFDLLQQGEQDGLDFINKIVGGKETEETIVEENSHKVEVEEVDEKLKDLPANPIDYLKRYPRSTEEEVKKYYSAKEVDKYINRGLIQKIRGRLVI